MKKILLFTLMLFLGIGAAVAAPAKKEVKTVVFHTDIHCHSCANKIMNNVPVFGKGIKDVKVDVDTKEVTIVYDSSKNSNENIISGFKSIKIIATVKDNNKTQRK